MKRLAFIFIAGGLCAAACSSRSSSPNEPTESTSPSSASDGVAPSLTTPSTPISVATSRNILTQHNDSQRTGAMLNETVLNTNNVSSTTFGLLRTLPVQGWVYAQPLYVEDLMIGGKAHKVIFIATAHNSVYAFDADNATDTTPLWEVNLGPSFPMSDFPGLTNLGPEEGIIATPVIELASQSMWLTAAFKEPATSTSAAVYKHQLFRLNILTGKTMAPSPILITASAPGTGFETVDGMVGFSEPTMLQRSSLLLANGQIYLGFAGAGVTAAYHGWFLSYDANTLVQTGAFTTSPNSSSSGIWQGGQGPAVDSNGYVYVCSADGNNSDATIERVESLIKFKHSAAGMQRVDYFTPANWKQFDIDDLDFGSTGVVLVPGMNMTVSGDKSGNLYFANT